MRWPPEPIPIAAITVAAQSPPSGVELCNFSLAFSVWLDYFTVSMHSINNSKICIQQLTQAWITSHLHFKINASRHGFLKMASDWCHFFKSLSMDFNRIILRNPGPRLGLYNGLSVSSQRCQLSLLFLVQWLIMGPESGACYLAIWPLLLQNGAVSTIMGALDINTSGSLHTDRPD